MLADAMALLRLDPERTRLLVRFGLGGAAVITAWDLVAALLLPGLVVAVVVLLLILAYAAVLVLLLAQQVQDAARWQLQSAISAEKLAGSRRREDDAPKSESVRAPAAQTAFHSAHFSLRLDEEVRKARREGSPLSLLCLDVSLPGRALSPEIVTKIGDDVAQLTSSQAATIAVATSTGDTSFAFCLPAMDRKSAGAFVSKVLHNLGDYWCHYGLASYPEDATNPAALMEKASAACEESRQDRPLAAGKVIA